jgi:HlyD family secretion protein
MTANVTIVVARRDDVLRVPNSALRFRPAESAGPSTASMSGRQRTVYAARGELDAAGRATGELEPVPVQTGLSDAAFTEIVSGISEGTVIVTGVALTPGGATTGATSTNPFMPKVPRHGEKR